MLVEHNGVFEKCKEIFVTQKEFGEFKVETTKAIAQIRSDTRAVKWLGAIIAPFLMAAVAELALLLIRGH